MPVLGDQGIKKYGKSTPPPRRGGRTRIMGPPVPDVPIEDQQDKRSNVAKAWDFLTEPRKNIPTLGSVARVYENAAQELWDLPKNTYRGIEALAGASPSGATPIEAGSAIVHQTAENWRHPTKYAYEHPIAFLSDLAAAGGLAYKGAELGSTSLRMAAKTPLGARLAAEETGAIGPFGRRLEAGEPVGISPAIGERVVPGEPFPQVGQWSSTRPRWGSGIYPSGERYSALLKQDVTAPGVAASESQAAGEVTSNMINRLMGERVRIPGSARTMLPEEFAGRRGMAEYPNTGTIIEDVPQMKEIGSAEQYIRHVTPPEARALSIYDMVIGNPDREVGYGGNMGYLPNEPHGQQLLAIDQGMGMSSGEKPLSYLDMALQPRQMIPEMAAFTGEEVQGLRQLYDYLSSHPEFVMNTPGAQNALIRTQYLLQNPQFPYNPTPAWGASAWRNG